MKMFIALAATLLLTNTAFAKEKAASKADRNPASVLKNKTGCPDGGLYFQDKEKWTSQISQIMSSAKYCADAVKLAERCGSSTPVLLAYTTTEAASRCEKDFAKNAEDKEGYAALVAKCEGLFQLGNGALAKWSVGQCYLNAAVFYSDLNGSRADLTH